jgi:hypothetical protein
MSIQQKKQWITFRVSHLEMRAIEAYCLQTKRTKTDVLREMLRKLPTYNNINGEQDLDSERDIQSNV